MKKASIEPVAQNCFQQLAQVAIYIGNGGRSDYAKCHPSICILQMGVKLFDAGINCPNFSGCDWCQHITWRHFICIDHQMKLLLALCHGFGQQLVPWTSLLVHQLEKSAQIGALHWHGLPIQCDQIKIYQQWSRTGLLLGECLVCLLHVLSGVQLWNTFFFHKFQDLFQGTLGHVWHRLSQVAELGQLGRPVFHGFFLGTGAWWHDLKRKRVCCNTQTDHMQNTNKEQICSFHPHMSLACLVS